MKCSGLSARREHHENFRCVSCETKAAAISEATTRSHAAANRLTLQASREACPEPCSYWLNLEESKKELMKNIYKQVVHWKAIICTLPRNKTSIKLTHTLNEILPATLNDSNAETTLYCAMVMPHLIFARTGTKDDASNS